MHLVCKAGLSLAFLTPLGLTVLAPSVQAQGPAVTFVLDQTDVTVNQGQTFTFTGSLHNNTIQALTIQSVVGIFEPTLSYTDSFIAFPSLAPNGSFVGTVFTIDTSKGFGGQASTPSR